MVETVDSLRVMVKLRWALGVKAGCEGGGVQKVHDLFLAHSRKACD